MKDAHFSTAVGVDLQLLARLDGVGQRVAFCRERLLKSLTGVGHLGGALRQGQVHRQRFDALAGGGQFCQRVDGVLRLRGRLRGCGGPLRWGPREVALSSSCCGVARRMAFSSTPTVLPLICWVRQLLQTLREMVFIHLKKTPADSWGSFDLPHRHFYQWKSLCLINARSWSICC